MKRSLQEGEGNYCNRDTCEHLKSQAERDFSFYSLIHSLIHLGEASQVQGLSFFAVRKGYYTCQCWLGLRVHQSLCSLWEESLINVRSSQLTNTLFWSVGINSSASHLSDQEWEYGGPMFDSYYHKLITKGRNYNANYKSKRKLKFPWCQKGKRLPWPLCS